MTAIVAARRASLRAPSALVLCVAIVAAGVATGGMALANLHNGLIALAFTAVGAFVVTRRPGHPEGRLFIAVGLVHAVMFSLRQQDEPWLRWLGVWPLALVLVLVGVTLMCFPDGHLPSPRWRVVVAVMIVLAAFIAFLSALWPVEYADDALSTPHPLHIAGNDTAQAVWNVAGPASYLLFQVAWVTCVVVRMRRATGDEARQMRWFGYAVGLDLALMAISLAVLHTPLLGVLGVPLIPLAAGLAVVKYRLYEIDPVLDKTLVVGAMLALISAGYVVVVVGLGALVPAPTPVLSLVATAAVAVGFEPVRRRVQVAVDRFVYGQRTTPYEALSRLLSAGADPYAGVVSSIAEGVGAKEATLWVGDSDELVAVASWPASASGARARLADLPGARPIGLHGAVTMSARALSAEQERLLGDLLALAGLVIETQAAAKRIVSAGDEARRRLERDLHDGAQQRLVTLALSLQSGAPPALGEIRGELLETLAELRELARGIHPAILTQDGLEAAIEFVAERAPLPVALDVRIERLPGEVEAAAYFVVSEALTNAAKHAGASVLRVSAHVSDGTLVLEVSDDGRGGATAGSGIQGLADRLVTLNGRLSVDSPPGAGTRLRAEIPCA